MRLAVTTDFGLIKGEVMTEQGKKGKIVSDRKGEKNTQRLKIPDGKNPVDKGKAKPRHEKNRERPEKKKTAEKPKERNTKIPAESLSFF